MLEEVASAGAVVSCTTTLKESLTVLPALSVALHCTVVVPSAKRVLELAAHTVATLPLTVSVATGSTYVTYAPKELVASAKTVEDVAIVGAVVSRTIIAKVLVVALPAASLALQSTLVVPSAKRLPEEGAQRALRVPLTASLAAGSV